MTAALVAVIDDEPRTLGPLNLPTDPAERTYLLGQALGHTTGPADLHDSLRAQQHLLTLLDRHHYSCGTPGLGIGLIAATTAGTTVTLTFDSATHVANAAALIAVPLIGRPVGRSAVDLSATVPAGGITVEVGAIVSTGEAAAHYAEQAREDLTDYDAHQTWHRARQALGFNSRGHDATVDRVLWDLYAASYADWAAHEDCPATCAAAEAVVPGAGITAVTGCDRHREQLDLAKDDALKALLGSGR